MKKGFELPMLSSLFAGDWVGTVNLIFPCNDGWFEMQLQNTTAPWQGHTSPVRFMVKSDNVGSNKFTQLYAMALTAFATGTTVWFGTSEGQSSFAEDGNCGTGNVAAQNVGGMSLNQ